MAFNVSIKIGTEKNLDVEVGQSMTVADLKETIALQQDLDSANISLIFQGVLLDNDVIVQNCNLGNHSILHAVIGQKKQMSAAKLVTQGLTEFGEQSLDKSSKTQGWGVQYFVYCKNVCRDVKPGKLRVCCAKCHDGAFMVHRGPVEWDDVLKPDKIQGQCLSETCDGNVAEFYFRCAGHQSMGDDDRVMALNLIKTNSQKIPCVICTETSNPVLICPCQDAHVMCVDCFTKYCRIKLNERGFVFHNEYGYTLGCPAGCDNSFIKEVHHFRVLGNVQYEKYKSFGTEEWLLQQEGAVICPNPGCGAAWQFANGEGTRKVVCQMQGLQGCGHIFCRDCLRSYHEGDCDDVDEEEELQARGTGLHIDPAMVLRARWDRASRETIKKTAKPCPNCKAPTQKNEGCQHMVCSRCRFEWCWLCCVAWNRDCQGDHWF